MLLELNPSRGSYRLSLRGKHFTGRRPKRGFCRTEPPKPHPKPPKPLNLNLNLRLVRGFPAVQRIPRAVQVSRQAPGAAAVSVHQEPGLGKVSFRVLLPHDIPRP